MTAPIVRVQCVATCGHGRRCSRQAVPSTAPPLCGNHHRKNKRDAAYRKRAAIDALGALTGPERVAVIRHYAGSAKKALAANTRDEYEAPS